MQERIPIGQNNEEVTVEKQFGPQEGEVLAVRKDLEQLLSKEFFKALDKEMERLKKEDRTYEVQDEDGAGEDIDVHRDIFITRIAVFTDWTLDAHCAWVSYFKVSIDDQDFFMKVESGFKDPQSNDGGYGEFNATVSAKEFWAHDPDVHVINPVAAYQSQDFRYYISEWEERYHQPSPDALKLDGGYLREQEVIARMTQAGFTDMDDSSVKRIGDTIYVSDVNIGLSNEKKDK